MRAAADTEDATDKSAVTPGPLAPARELLGEMLLEAGDAGGARRVRSIDAKEPGRFRALLARRVRPRRLGNKAAAAEVLPAGRGDRKGLGQPAARAEARTFVHELSYPRLSRAQNRRA